LPVARLERALGPIDRAQCRKVGDNGTAELLEDMLEDTEEHANRLETQLTAIRQIGLAQYLAEQLEAES
jgi:bacterioferritin